MNDKFPLLSIISSVFRIVGGILLLPSIYFFLWEGLIEPKLPSHFFSQNDFFELMGGLFGCLISLGVIAMGEIIGVLFSIEKNTRQ
ncbi:MAG: hypothetical protein FJZ79_00825 [Chlorobi bacterium]|nr:hypothetical protein [Chlorobiota bacterium]